MDQKLQLQLQPRWLHYTTTTTPLHYNYNYNCTTSHYIQQLWVRWPLQTLQPVQETQLRPPFGPSVDSLCHPWFTIHLSYRFPIFETSATGLCGTTGTAYMHHDLHWDWQSFSNVADLSIASRLKVKVSIWSKMREAVKLWQTQLRDIMVKTYSGLWKQKLRLAWEGWVSPVFLDPRIAQWRTSALDLLRLSSLIECSNQDLLHMEPITWITYAAYSTRTNHFKAVDIFGRCLRRTLKDCCPTASGLSWLLQQNSRELETLKLGQRPYAVLGNAFEKSCKGLDLGFPKLFRK